MKFRFLFVLFLGFVVSKGFGQHKITGRVVDFDTEKPIESAIVWLNNFTSKTITNHLGYFQVFADSADIIQIRHKGYAISNFSLPGKSHFLVKLKKADPSSIFKIDEDYVKGELQGVYKTGIWSYYDTPGQLAFKYDCDLRQVVYIRPDTSQYALKFEEGYKMSHVDRPPRPLGSMYFLYTALSTFRYPKKALDNLTAGTLYVMFEVNIFGLAGNYTVINDIGDGCGDEVVKALKNSPLIWMPAMFENKIYTSRFIIPVTLTIQHLKDKNLKSTGKKRKHRRSKEYLPVARVLHEYTIPWVLIN